MVTTTDGIDLDKIAYTPSTGVSKTFPTKLVEATPESIKGYGHIITSSPETFPIEIVRWPAQGWRPVDENSGDQGGVTEGIFEFWWKGDTLYARNNAVGDSYLFAWSKMPEDSRTTGESRKAEREKALMFHANYHPDGGQLFFPRDERNDSGEDGGRHGFVVPLALPGDDVKPEDFTAFYCPGGKGLYIHPNIWHGSVVPLDDQCRLLDRQGKVHARVSVDFAKEFGGYLEVSLRVT